MEKEIELKYCLNCGEEINGKFCSNCGQPTSIPQKLNNRTFGKSVVMCFTRLSGAFLNTLVKLCYKPWEVIRDFIHGRQMPYSHPVTMLIQLALVVTFLGAALEGIFDYKALMVSAHYEGGWFIRSLKESTVIRIMWYLVPFIVAGYLAYWKYGSRRFSFSEYLIAGLYLIISVRIYSSLLLPINYFSGNDETIHDIGVYTSLAIGFVFGIITIYKAFPIPSRWKRIMQLTFFLVLAFVIMIAYATFFNYIDDLLMGKDMDNWFEKMFED